MQADTRSTSIVITIAAVTISMNFRISIWEKRFRNAPDRPGRTDGLSTAGAGPPLALDVVASSVNQ
jgi:hypothetical protein